jgi:hypothetical protein
MKIQKNKYHIVLERPTLQLLGALPGDGVILINDLIILVAVTQLGYVLLGVGRLQEKLRLQVKPPKVLLVWSQPMHNTTKVVHLMCLPLVPQRNICDIFSTLVHHTLNFRRVIMHTEQTTN